MLLLPLTCCLEKAIDIPAYYTLYKWMLCYNITMMLQAQTTKRNLSLSIKERYLRELKYFYLWHAETRRKRNSVTTDYYDSKTGKREMRVYHRTDGPIDRVDFYDAKTGKRTQTIYYRPDGTGTERAEYYNITAGKIYSRSYCRTDGTLDRHEFYDANTGKLDRRIYLRADGTPKRADRYDPTTGMTTAHSYYSADGKTILRIERYDPKTGERKGTDL